MDADANANADAGGSTIALHERCSGELKRNIKVHNKDLKSTTFTLVRPQLEYASTVWSLHTATDISKLEAV